MRKRKPMRTPNAIQSLCPPLTAEQVKNLMTAFEGDTANFKAELRHLKRKLRSAKTTKKTASKRT